SQLKIAPPSDQRVMVGDHHAPEARQRPRRARQSSPQDHPFTPGAVQIASGAVQNRPEARQPAAEADRSDPGGDEPAPEARQLAPGGDQITSEVVQIGPGAHQNAPGAVQDRRKLGSYREKVSKAPRAPYPKQSFEDKRVLKLELGNEDKKSVSNR